MPRIRASSVTGAPAMPGSVVATIRTPETTRSGQHEVERAGRVSSARQTEDRAIHVRRSRGQELPGFAHDYLPVSGSAVCIDPPSVRRRDVLVVPEHVRGVPGLLQLTQPLVGLPPVRSLDTQQALVADEVQ